MLSKNVHNKKCDPKLVFFNEKKNWERFRWFWSRKLTLKVKFWRFLKVCHYSNSPNLVISFDYTSFLAKKLSNFVSLPWKLHNRYYHTKEWIESSVIGFSFKCVQYKMFYFLDFRNIIISYPSIILNLMMIYFYRSTKSEFEYGSPQSSSGRTSQY